MLAVIVEVAGRQVTLSQLAEEYGINHKTMQSRYYRGVRGDGLIRPVKKPQKLLRKVTWKWTPYTEDELYDIWKLFYTGEKRPCDVEKLNQFMGGNVCIDEAMILWDKFERRLGNEGTAG